MQLTFCLVKEKLRELHELDVETNYVLVELGRKIAPLRRSYFFFMISMILINKLIIIDSNKNSTKPIGTINVSS